MFETRASIIAKVVILVAAIYIALIFVLPYWEKAKIESRDFSRKLILDAVVITLDAYKINTQHYPLQKDMDGCFSKEGMEKEYIEPFSEKNFPFDPKKEQSFLGKCFGQLWYKDLKGENAGEGFILGINVESDETLRKNPTKSGFACLSPLIEAKRTIKAMKKALAETNCFNSFSTDEIVAVVMKE